MSSLENSSLYPVTSASRRAPGSASARWPPSMPRSRLFSGYTTTKIFSSNKISIWASGDNLLRNRWQHWPRPPMGTSLWPCRELLAGDLYKIQGTWFLERKSPQARSMQLFRDQLSGLEAGRASYMDLEILTLSQQGRDSPSRILAAARGCKRSEPVLYRGSVEQMELQP